MTDKYFELLKCRLLPERYNHSLGVMETAGKLAEHYGMDVKKAETAGLLHDVTKNCSESEHIEMFKKYNIEYDTELLRAPKIFHQITGAYFVKCELHINDPDIFGAIRYHATGHKNMTLFEKIIYIADFIEPERDFADVDTCRSLAFKDLDKACFAYIKFCIEKNVKKGSYIYKDTFEFYNSLTEVV